MKSFSDGEKAIRCTHPRPREEDQQVLFSFSAGNKSLILRVFVDLFSVYFVFEFTLARSRVAFEETLHDMGPSILPASHPFYKRSYLIFVHFGTLPHYLGQ